MHSYTYINPIIIHIPVLNIHYAFKPVSFYSSYYCFIHFEIMDHKMSYLSILFLRCVNLREIYTSTFISYIL